MPSPVALTLGIRPNLAQFSLLVVINALVGAMIGLERSILPSMARQDFHLDAKTAILSFLIVFGISKAITNYWAGRLSDRWGRKIVLILGWWIALPVPLLLIWAPTWTWILAANLLLGVSQGLTWSTTVIMKTDLAGPRQRGLAMGLNEFAGYLAVATSALATGFVADRWGLRPYPFYLGVFYALMGLGLSIFFVRETHAHARHEARAKSTITLTQWQIFARTTYSNPNLSAVTQAGLVNNLNDGMAWGLFPILFAANGMSLRQIGSLAALYPAVWGVTQVFTGGLSDRLGRKLPIVSGMTLQALGLAVTALSSRFVGFSIGAVMLGLGTALVYPTFLAAIGDEAHPSWRASATGVFRLWRDLGYAFGALLSGVIADLLGVEAAVWTVAVMTGASGVVVAIKMKSKDLT